SGLIVPVFQKGDDPIDVINHMMSFLTAVVTSRYPTTNNQLRNSSNPRQQATINNGKEQVEAILGNKGLLSVTTAKGKAIVQQHSAPKPKRNGIAMHQSEQSNVVTHLETEINSDSNIIPYSHVNDTLTAELERYKEQVKVLKEGQNVDLRSNDTVSDSSA
ncbi:hypothetical protein Tco_1266765, partial [Tanacetum coccineum]